MKLKHFKINNWHITAIEDDLEQVVVAKKAKHQIQLIYPDIQELIDEVNNN